MNSIVQRYRSRLDGLFGKVNEIDDIEMQAQWARYLCVLASGFIEESIKTIIGEYAVARSSREIANYVERKLDRETNLNMQKIVSLLSQFDPDKGKELEKRTNGELKAAVDSVISNRHHIAHGRDVGVSYVRIHDWYKKTIKVIEIVDALLV